MARGLILTVALMILAVSPVRAQYAITATAVITEPLVADAVTLAVRSSAAGLEVSAVDGIATTGSSVLRHTYVAGVSASPATAGIGRATAADGQSLERRAVQQAQFPVLQGRLPEGAAVWLSADARTLVVTRVVAANS